MCDWSSDCGGDDLRMEGGVKFALTLERATQVLRESGKLPDDDMLQFLSPLGWEHINLTGDYVWRQSRKVDEGKYRPLRDFKDRS